MPQTNLHRSYVDTDVREVFENCSVEEIRGVQRRINHEIERKREELRMLVGERYRDLIDAADTICTMNTSSIHVFQKLSTLRTSINKLQNQLTLSSNISLNQNKESHKGKLTAEEHEVIAELKLSIEIPIEVQHHLEKQDIIPALHFVLFFTRKLVPSGQKYRWTFLETEGQDLVESARVISESIMQFCNSGLDSNETPYQMLAECMIVKQIINNSTADEVLSAWLKTKVSWCSEALKHRNSEFLAIVARTLEGVYKIFIEPVLYSISTKAIRKYKITPSSFGFRVIPNIVKEYNEKTISVDEPIRATLLATILRDDFVTPIKQLLENQRSYLAEFTTFVQLQDYRQKSIEILKESEELTRLILGPTTSLWTHVFSPVFQRRAEEIAKSVINEIFTFLRKIGFPKFKAADATFDLVSFVWTPSAINPDRTPPNDNLKIKCLTPNICQLCEDLEFRFSELIVDFQALGDPWLKEFISTQLIQEFEEFVRNVTKDENSDEGTVKSFGRFSTGLTDICPTLWKLLDKNDGVKLKQLMLDRSEKCWTQWTNQLLKVFETELEKRMGDLTPENITSFMPMAEIYEAETREDGQKFLPSVRIPVEITHTLHSLLFSICMEISKVGPQVISKSVKDNFRSSLAKSVLGFYEKLLEVGGGGRIVTSQMALQFIFDLKFVQWFHSSLAGTTDGVVHKLRNLIDPFDWDIVNSRLTLNLKRFLFENQLTMGLLFSEENHGFIAQNFKTKNSLSFPMPTRNLIYNQLPLLPL